MKITGNYSNGELELGLSTGTALTKTTYNKIFDKNKISYKEACGLFNDSGYAENLSYDLLNDDMKGNLRDYVIDHCDAGLSGYFKAGKDTMSYGMTAELTATNGSERQDISFGMLNQFAQRSVFNDIASGRKSGVVDCGDDTILKEDYMLFEDTEKMHQKKTGQANKTEKKKPKHRGR